MQITVSAYNQRNQTIVANFFFLSAMQSNIFNRVSFLLVGLFGKKMNDGIN